MTEQTKYCYDCKEIKPVIEFSKNKSTKDGFTSECKECAKKRIMRWYSNNREYCKKKCKKYYLKNKETIDNSNRKWKKNNPEYMKEYMKIYSLEHKTDKRERDRIYWLKNKSKITEYYKQWYRNNNERCKEYAKKYIKNNPLQKINSNHKRRAKYKHTDITKKWLKELYDNANICPICNKKMDNDSRKYPNGKSLDHILPLNVGGLHIKDNVRITCFKCNQSRPKDGSDILQLERCAKHT